jgi:hypothetical protein
VAGILPQYVRIIHILEKEIGNKEPENTVLKNILEHDGKLSLYGDSGIK